MNFTGAVKKIQKHFAQQGRFPITGDMNGDYAEVMIDGTQHWVLMNGRKK